MKRMIVAAVSIVVLAHIVLFATPAIRGGEANGEPSPRESGGQAVHAQAPAEPVAPLGPPADAYEVLDRYAATQDGLYASFHIKAESTAVVCFPDGTREARYFSYGLLYDGRRFRTTEEMRKGRSPSTKRTWVWDGQTFFFYGSGSMVIRREATEFDKSLYTKLGHESALRGYLGSDKRIDQLLREADGLTLRTSTELVDGAACYVVDATFSYGKYSIWFDATHGYNIARAVYEKELGHPLSDGRPAPFRCHATMSDVQFKEVAGRWVPVAAKTQGRVENPNYGTRTETTQYRRTQVDLNPVFSDDAFVPDCPDGAVVRIDWIHDRSARFQTGYTWKNGQVLDPQGRVISLAP